jgi:glucose-6-phosphate 1-epimerase
MAAIYEYTRHPPYWIVHDEEGYWLVPARNGGWEERETFVGHVAALRPILDVGGIRLGMPSQDDTRT